MNILEINESGIIGGIIEINDSIIFNVTLVDDYSEVQNVWLKVWDGTVGISNILFDGFFSFVADNLWTISVETNESFPTEFVNYSIYVNNSFGSEVNVSGNWNEF